MKKMMLYAALATLLSFSTAQATVIIIDDFLGIQGPISDLTVNGVPVTTDNGTRFLSIDATAIAPPIPNSNSLVVDSGVLEVTNGSGDDSEAIVRRNLAANLIPLGGFNPTFRFSVGNVDNNGVNIAITVGGSSLQNVNLPGTSSNSPQDFMLTPAQVALINLGGPLQLTINGGTGWDLTLNAISLTHDEVGMVPEPSTISLLGLGLLGLGWNYRRRSGSVK